MVRQSSADGPQRFKSLSRKLSTAKTRYAWRTKTKRKYIKRTPAEKAALKEKRQSEKKMYNDALQEAREVVLQQATQLHERFGGHSVQHYFEQILQQSRMKKRSRKVSRWNAYLRSEVKRINDGKLL
jgi:hypothetical protein